MTCDRCHAAWVESDIMTSCGVEHLITRQKVRKYDI